MISDRPNAAAGTISRRTSRAEMTRVRWARTWGLLFVGKMGRRARELELANSCERQSMRRVMGVTRREHCRAWKLLVFRFCERRANARSCVFFVKKRGAGDWR